MTDTIEAAAPAKNKGLSAMLLPELKQLGASLGLKGTGAMRKSQLIDAIRTAQGGTPQGSTHGGGAPASAPAKAAAAPAGEAADTAGEPADKAEPRRKERTRASDAPGPAEAPDASGAEQSASGGDDVAARLEALQGERGRRRRNRNGSEAADSGAAEQPSANGTATAEPTVDSRPQQVERQQSRDDDDFGNGRRSRRRRRRSTSPRWSATTPCAAK